MTENVSSGLEHVTSEIDLLKQIRSMTDQISRLEDDINALKQDRIDVADRQRILIGKIKDEIDLRHTSDKEESAKLTKYIDKGIAAVTEVIGSHSTELATETKSLQDDIRSIKTDIYYMKSQILSIQSPVGMGNIEARYDWVIETDLSYISWSFAGKTSGYFTGAAHPYKYRLAMASGTSSDSVLKYLMDVINGAKSMFIWLCIHPSANDEQLEWPFERRVVVTVTDKEKIEACSTISQQCRIPKPNYDHSRSDYFVFLFSELTEAGINLSHGVRVSCVILSDTDR